jgi:ABC-2 type transport system ATP-binding protein
MSALAGLVPPVSDIDEICDRIAILHNSKIIFIGKPDEFKKSVGIENLERAFLKAIEG